ncbi:Protein ssh4 [Malassezia sp. CBS 17886]|nr:Protein ssh4 [Malassezia sp. CBS 17886]
MKAPTGLLFEAGARESPPWQDDAPELFALLLPLLILGLAMVLVAVTPLVLFLVLRLRGGISIGEQDGPVDVAYDEQLDSAGGLQGVQQRWLEHADDATRRGFERAARWSAQHPPASSRDTDITMPQFLGIQEKGVSAWSFDPAYEANQGVLVSGRTEIQFFADSPDMAPSEGGACSMQTNLPLPKMNDVYYFEAKIFTKPPGTALAIGLATKPYPPFRFPGFCKHSVAYFSQDGFKCHNHPFAAQSYAAPYMQSDVIGVGYRARTGAVFFTRNGRRLDEAFVGLHSYNLFPTVAADGAAEVHVNFGQAAFVLVEANVKKWGLAPMVGTLAPPPAYGQDKGSILIESGDEARRRRAVSPPPRAGAPELARVPSYDSSTDVFASGSASSAGAVRPAAGNAAAGIRMDNLHGAAAPRLQGASNRPPPYSTDPCGWHTGGSPQLAHPARPGVPAGDAQRTEHARPAGAPPEDAQMRDGSASARAPRDAQQSSSHWWSRWTHGRDAGGASAEAESTNAHPTELTGVIVHRDGD